MNIRYEYLQNLLSLGDSGEYVFDIGSNDNITRLDISFKATNGATSNIDATIADTITSFELMDGSNIILSLTGAELGGMVANRTGRFPGGKVSEILSEVQELKFSIDFGRWYGDEDFSLDLSKFKNLQARLRWNLAAIRAVGATGFVSGSARYTVLAHVLEGSRNPFAYLALRRHSLFSTAASGEELVTLPTDNIIRGIAIRSYEAGVGGLSGISNIRLSADEGRYKPLDLSVADYLESLIINQPPFEYNHRFFKADTGTAYTLLKYKESAVLSREVLDTVAQYVHADIGQGTVIAMVASTGLTDATARITNARVEGYLPFGTAYLGFGTYDDPNSWLEATAFRNLRMYLEQNNAGATCSVIVEEMRTY